MSKKNFCWIQYPSLKVNRRQGQTNLWGWHSYHKYDSYLSNSVIYISWETVINATTVKLAAITLIPVFQLIYIAEFKGNIKLGVSQFWQLLRCTDFSSQNSPIGMLISGFWELKSTSFDGLPELRNIALTHQRTGTKHSSKTHLSEARCEPSLAITRKTGLLKKSAALKQQH